MSKRTNRHFFSEGKRLIMANEHTRKCLSFVIENLGSTNINEDINEMPFLAHQIGKNENALSYGVFVRM